MSDIDFYIMQFEPEVQRRFMEIRLTAFDTFESAEERIYHGIPTFMINGKDILNYGAYKDHITMYIGYDLRDFLKSQYPQRRYTKAAMQIPEKDSFPDELIREIYELLKQNIVSK